MSGHVFLGLGSNLGNRQANIVAALQMLAGSTALELGQLSSLYASPSWGYASENEFLNCVAGFTLGNGLPAAWREIQAIEQRLGKHRRTGSATGYRDRSIDIDVLWADAGESPGKIELPHPRAHERAFVLIPWIEIAGGDFVLNGQPLQQWLTAIPAAERDDMRCVMAAGELRGRILSCD